jgi:hypothetical protein
VPAAQDAMIFATSAGMDTGNASGKGPAIFAGADGSSNRKRGPLRFDIASSNIPADAVVSDVTMTLYLAQVAGSGGGSGGGGSHPTRIFSLHELRQDWGEGNSGSPTSPGVGGTGQGYPRQSGDSTWDYAFYNAADTTAGKWNFGGADSSGGDFDPAASATSTFTNFSTLNAPFTWTSPGMAADVQGWIGGTSPNFGWLLRSDNLESSPTSFLGFWSKDGAAANNNPAIAPALSITYTSVVPEPACAGVFAGGALLLIRTRRARRRGE